MKALLIVGLVILQIPGSGPRVPPNFQPRGPNCNNLCFLKCHQMPCAGLDPIQCQRAKQQCRISCGSRC